MDEEDVVTIDEIIKADEEDGALIYGGISDFGDNCTYPRVCLTSMLLFI